MMRYLFRSLYTAMFLSAFLGLVVYLTKPNNGHQSKETLNVFVWGDFLSHETMAEFEKEYNIPVNLHYYTSNEEMLAKLRYTKGKGYDIIFPSDYAVEVLAKERFIRPLKKYKIEASSKIEPFLLGHKYDPDNTYSLPYTWESYLIAKDDSLLPTPDQPKLSQLFDQSEIDYKVVMTPDPVEAFVFAAIYLYGSTENLSAGNIKEIRNLLRTQKGWVEAYADFRAKYLLSTKNCPLVLLKSSYINQTIRENPDVSFLIPKEGACTSIENIVICSDSEKEEEAYALINFLYRPEQMAKAIDTCPLYPAIPEALDQVENPVEPEFIDTLDALKDCKHHFFNYPIPPDQIREIWLEVKSNPPIK